jgi:hypothetical protein
MSLWFLEATYLEPLPELPYLVNIIESEPWYIPGVRIYLDRGSDAHVKSED